MGLGMVGWEVWGMGACVYQENATMVDAIADKVFCASKLVMEDEGACTRVEICVESDVRE